MPPQRPVSERALVGDESDEFSGPDTSTRRAIQQQDVLVGQLLEAVKGLRRDSVAQTAAVEKYSRAQTQAIEAIAAKVEKFDRLVERGRWMLIGMGLASLCTLVGTGMVASKLLELFWPK